MPKSSQTSRRRRGADAEALAAAYLQRQGYQIVAQNFRFGRFGEIDLIASKGELLVFVEVKARRSLRFGLPEEHMTARKRRAFLRAVKGYLLEHGLEGVPCRFDFIAVDLSTTPPQLRHYEAAFGSEEAL
jgi:putative endonuclease